MNVSVATKPIMKKLQNLIISWQAFPTIARNAIQQILNGIRQFTAHMMLFISLYIQASIKAPGTNAASATTILPIIKWIHVLHVAKILKLMMRIKTLQVISIQTIYALPVILQVMLTMHLIITQLHFLLQEPIKIRIAWVVIRPDMRYFYCLFGLSYCWLQPVSKSGS